MLADIRLSFCLFYCFYYRFLTKAIIHFQAFEERLCHDVQALYCRIDGFSQAQKDIFGDKNNNFTAKQVSFTGDDKTTGHLITL